MSTTTEVESERLGDASPIPANYGVLLERVRAGGLLARSYTFYLSLTAVLSLALVAAVAGMVLLGDSWAQLALALASAVILTQFAFLGHEASHRQVFRSKRANDLFGRFIATFVVGISYSWWMNKHTRHHANPNQLERDPDIAPGVIEFQPEAAPRSRARQWFLRHQGTLFFPLLLLEGLHLHIQGVRYLLNRSNRLEGRALELSMLLVRLAAAPILALTLTSPAVAVGMLVVQLGAFGLYMGASFAPNHKGMPQVPARLKLSFVHKQVLTSRNISTRGSTALLGGLNYQIEHHLFPNMARPHLRKAAAIVRSYCREIQIPYTSVGLGDSYRRVIQYLNSVGTADRDVFVCPLVTKHGRL
ncbi:fatty acid desaturase family protein [Curtobacterium flaccumfaciens]|uniref:fatty acid desaturase family protein n=1 Tax=Curtobacterium flaccumfaciens TaxID=2035 RepID=UPI001E4DBE31|nr:acyl-CoA desaturase [Curtobacterium allii]MCE0459484.1 acyl-CoA desaturase [Curtobacterium allii]